MSEMIIISSWPLLLGGIIAGVIITLMAQGVWEMVKAIHNAEELEECPKCGGLMSVFDEPDTPFIMRVCRNCSLAEKEDRATGAVMKINKSLTKRAK